MRDAYRSVDVHDHLSSGLVALAVVGSFLLLLQHAVSRGSVLQRKLAEDFAEPVDADLSHAVSWMSEVQQERMEPGKKGWGGCVSIYSRCNAVTGRFTIEI